MGGKVAKPPDYAAAADAQAQSSKNVTEQQTWANRPDQFTPWGAQTWQNQQVYDPATQQMINRWSQNTELTPESKKQFDSQQRVATDKSQLAESLTGRMKNEYGQAVDFSGVQRGGGALEGGSIQGNLSTEGLQGVDPSQRYYDKAGDALYSKWAQRALPAQQRESEALRTRLVNQGLNPGDEAYDAEIAKQRMAQGDAQQQAGFEATGRSGAEAARMYGMDTGTRAQQFGERQAQGSFGNQAQAQDFGQQVTAGGYETSQRQDQIAEIMQQRGFSLNEINAILNGQQVQMPSAPSFNTAQRAEGNQALQATKMQDESNQAQAAAKMAVAQGVMSGASGMAGGFMGV